MRARVRERRRRGVRRCPAISEGERNLERHRRASAERRLTRDDPAERADDVAGDGEAEPRASVLARAAGARLPERHEDDPDLILGDADARVHNLEADPETRRVVAVAKVVRARRFGRRRR